MPADRVNDACPRRSFLTLNASRSSRPGKRLASAGADDAERLARPAQTVKVNQGWNSQRVAREHPCGAPGSARLVRRHVDTFWFQQCARRHTDYSQLAAALNLLVGAPPSTPKPMNIILRSGLFFSPSVKAAAAAIRGAIGGPYACSTCAAPTS